MARDKDIKDEKEELNKKLIYEEHETGYSLPHQKPLPKLTNVEATLMAPHVDITKAQTAFGRLAIPKLRKDILHHNLVISRQSLIALLDLVHNPEKAIEAINLNILARLVRLLVSPDDYTRHHTLCVLRVLAGQPKGPAAIADNQYIIKNLKATLNDAVENVRLETAKTLLLLGRSWFYQLNLNEIPPTSPYFIVNFPSKLIPVKSIPTVQTVPQSNNYNKFRKAYTCIIQNDFVVYILKRIFIEVNWRIQKELLEALENILDKSDFAKSQAVQMNACSELAPLLLNPEVKSAVIAVYTQIFMISEGKEAVEEDLLSMLINAFQEGDEESLKHIISLAFLFVTTTLKHQGFAIKIIDVVLPVTIKSSNPVITKFAIQVLTNFAAHPRIRAYLRDECLEVLQNINTYCDKSLTEFKDRLLEVVTYKV